MYLMDDLEEAYHFISKRTISKSYMLILERCSFGATQEQYRFGCSLDMHLTVVTPVINAKTGGKQFINYSITIWTTIH